MQHVRVDHDPQRQLLQVRELRNDQRLRIDTWHVGHPFKGAASLVLTTKLTKDAKGARDSNPRALSVLSGFYRRGRPDCGLQRRVFDLT